MPSKRGQRLGFSTPELCRIAGVAPSTLNYWAQQGIVTPSLLGPGGKRFGRYWSVEDLVLVRAVKALREAGCPLQRVRQVRRHLVGVWDRDLTNTVLYWDGSDVIATDQWGEIYSLLAEPGQQLLHLVAVPLGQWLSEARGSAALHDVEAARARRKQASARPRTPSIRLPASNAREVS